MRGLNLLCGSVASPPIPDSRRLSFFLENCSSFRSLHTQVAVAVLPNNSEALAPWQGIAPSSSISTCTPSTLLFHFLFVAGLRYLPSPSQHICFAILLQDSLNCSLILKIITETSCVCGGGEHWKEHKREHHREHKRVHERDH